MKISFIIPAYNAATTIKETLLSIINQKLQKDSSFEIIVVDDASNDDTVQIAKSIKDRRLSVYSRKEKTNAGSCRNYGLNKINGDYVWFVDSDDFVEANALNTVIRKIEKGHNDIIEFGYHLLDEKTNNFRTCFNIDEEILIRKTSENSEYSIDIYPELLRSIAYPWNKVYKTSFIKLNNIKFSEIPVHNDLAFKIKAELSASSIGFVHKYLYTHVINRKAQQLTQVSDRNRLSIIDALNEVDSFIKSQDDIFLSSVIENYDLFKFNTLGWAYNRCNDEYKPIILKYIYDEFYKLSYNSRTVLSFSNYLESPIRKIFNENFRKPNFNVEKVFDGIGVSVVVTTYNVEKYIKKTILCLEQQTISKFNYEIIVVDDCSTDDTVKIIEELMNEYDNIKLIKLPTNTPGGVASAANVGVKASTGKFIMFCDGDDYVSQDFIIKPLKVALSNNSDLVIFNYKLDDANKNKQLNALDNKYFNSLIKKEQITKIKTSKADLLRLNPAPWRKLYKSDFIKNNNIQYIESEFFFEDNPYHWQNIIKASNIDLCNQVLVFHLINREGQTTTGKDKRYFAFIRHYKDIRDWLLSQGLFDDYKIHLLRWILGQSTWIINRLGTNKPEYADLISRELIKDYSVDDLVEMRKIYPCRYSSFLFQKSLLSGNVIKGIIAKNLIVYPEVLFKKLRKLLH